MITGIFHKLNVVETYMTTTSGTLLSTAGAASTLPTGPTLFQTFPTLDSTATAKQWETSLFLGGRIEKKLIGRFSGNMVNTDGSSNFNIEVTGNTIVPLINPNAIYFLSKVSGTAVIGGTNVGRLAGSLIVYTPGTDTTTVAANVNGTHSLGTIEFDLFERVGFSRSNFFTLYSVNSATTATAAKYMSMTIGFFSNNGGAATKSVVVLLPLNCPFKVKLQDSEMAVGTFTTAVTAVSPSFTTLIDGVQVLKL